MALATLRRAFANAGHARILPEPSSRRPQSQRAGEISEYSSRRLQTKSRRATQSGSTVSAADIYRPEGRSGGGLSQEKFRLRRPAAASGVLRAAVFYNMRGCNESHVAGRAPA